MKIYDTYGAMHGEAGSVEENARNTTAVALRVQQALDVDMYARADRQPYSHYGRTLCDDDACRHYFAASNVDDPRESAPFPEYDYAVIVGVGEPADPQQTQAALEAVGLTLVRRRRRAYAAPEEPAAVPILDLYGAPTHAAVAVGVLSPLLGMAFDGNEHAATGGDSHYYDESMRFGTMLVFDNTPKPFDDQPFPQYADSTSVVIVVNPAEREELRRRLIRSGFELLKSAGSEARA